MAHHSSHGRQDTVRFPLASLSSTVLLSTSIGKRNATNTSHISTSSVNCARNTVSKSMSAPCGIETRSSFSIKSWPCREMNCQPVGPFDSPGAATRAGGPGYWNGWPIWAGKQDARMLPYAEFAEFEIPTNSKLSRLLLRHVAARTPARGTRNV